MMDERELLTIQPERMNHKNNPWRPVLAYVIFGFFWIAFSDSILGMVVTDADLYQHIQTFKGLFYVLLTGGGLYMLVKWDNRRIFRLHKKIHEKNEELVAYAEETVAIDRELQSQIAQMNHMVYYDQLTGLKNRYSFEVELSKLLGKGDTFGVYYLDVDHFKNLNDIYGHSFGDVFLQAYTRMLIKHFPALTIYRWGGDEFIIIDKESDESTRLSTARDILELTDKTWVLDGIDFRSSTSVGVVECPKHGDDLHTIFKNLEVTLYRAKEDGRAKCEVFDKTFREDLERKALLEGVINTALEEEGFTLYYQPIYDLKKRKTERLEVLLRFDAASTYNTNIGEVINIAEQTGQVHRIDNWVLNKVFQTIKAQQKHLPDMKLSVNISAQTFASDHLIQYLEDLIERYDVDASGVVLEVTEHTIIQNMEESLKTMRLIKSLGFKMAMDDFGTRYSSLNYLSRLPFDILKIDKSYVDHINEDTNHMIIIKHIIQLAEAIGLSTVGEGIETKEQEEALRLAGCRCGQGYHYAKPMAFDDLTTFIKAQGPLTFKL